MWIKRWRYGIITIVRYWHYCGDELIYGKKKRIKWFSHSYRGRNYPPGGISRDRGTSIPLGGRASMKRYDPPSTFIYSLPLNLRGGQALPTPGGGIPATDVFNILFFHMFTYFYCSGLLNSNVWGKDR